MRHIFNEEKVKKTGEYYERYHQLEIDYLKYWQENTLWHWDFWLSVALTIIPWIIWFIVRKRGSEARLLLAGSFGVIISSWLDFIGVSYGLWQYSGKVLPTIPAYAPWDFTLIPVFIMLCLQFKPYLNPLLKAVIFASITSFIGEPLFEFFGLYKVKNWSVLYSLPIYTFIYLIAFRISKAKTFDNL